jgi:DNA primase
MITARTKEEILAASRIEEVVGDFVNLKKRGTNFVGLCPFHTEKTPSFHVSPSKGIYKCFGCGKGGDSVSFVMEHEKFTYPEALRFLAQKYNIAVEETGDVKQEQGDKMVKESLYIVNQFAQEYYHDNLLKTQEGKTIGLSYFKERGFSDEMTKKFKLGYALNDVEAFTKTALKNGYQLEFLKKAGLVKDRMDRQVDFFQGRVIFPILNLSGKVVAFAGRVMVKGDQASKYINSPETEVYHKSQLVYGIYHARNAIRKDDECFLTEGYTDVISMHHAGIENVVASSGTSLTVEQIKLIKRFTDNITILYDGDPAGIKAALRGLEMMAEEDVNVRVVLLPDGDDPDSFLHKKGSTALREFIRTGKKHFLQFKMELLLKEAGDDPLKKAGVIREVIETLSKVPDLIKRAVLIKESSQSLEVSEQVLMTEINKIKRKQFKKETGAPEYEADRLQESLEGTTELSPNRQQANGEELQERDVVRLLLEFGKEKMAEGQSVSEYIISEVHEAPMINIQYRMMVHETEEQLAIGRGSQPSYFMQHADLTIRNLTTEIILIPLPHQRKLEQDARHPRAFSAGEFPQ